MAVSIKNAKTNLIPDWTQSDIDKQIALGNLPTGTTPAKMTLNSDWNANLVSSMATNKLVGRGTSGTGSFEEITLGTNLSLSGTTLNATGGGGTPGGSSGDIQYNNSGAFGGYTVVPLPNGGTGLSNGRTNFSSSGTVAAYSPTTVWNVYTGSSASMRGMVAQTDGTEIVFTNGGSLLIFFNEDTGATAANRFTCAGGVNMTIPPGASVRWRYSTSTSRWKAVGGYPYAAPSADGIIAAASYNSWNGKVDKITGAAGGVAYWIDSTTISSDVNNAFYQAITKRFGFQRQGGDPTGILDIDNTAPTIINPLGSFAATLTLFTPLSPPVSGSAVQSPGHLYAPTSFAGVSSPDSSTYIASDSIDYRITVYDSTGTLTYSVVSTITNVVILAGSGASDGDQVILNWSANGAGTATISGYILERQINGGGYNSYIDLGNTTSATDDSTLVNGNPWIISTFYPPSPMFPDFIANSSNSFSYDAYGKQTFSTTDVFSSTQFNYTFMDNGSGDPFVINHSLSTLSRVLKGGSSYHDGTSFTEDTTTFIGGSTVTPTTYGTASDGSFWTQDFTAWNKQSSPVLYSTTNLSSSTFDPSDFQTYYVTFTFSGQVNAAKILKSGSGSETQTVSPFYYDGSTGFGGDTTTTPTGLYPSNIVARQGVTQEAIQIVEDSNAVGSIIFRDSANGTVRGGISYNSNTGNTYFFNGVSASGLNTDPWLRFDSNKNAFLNGFTQVNLSVGAQTILGLSSSEANFAKTIVTPASTTSIPAVTITSGSTPSSPTSGNMWFDGTHLQFRIGGTTYQIDQQGGGGAAYYTWNTISGTTQSMAANNAYIANNASLVTATLPSTAAVGDRVQLVGKGAGKWLIAQNSGQIIIFNGTSSTTGTGGSLAANNLGDCVELVCITANTTWRVFTSESAGGFTVT